MTNLNFLLKEKVPIRKKIPDKYQHHSIRRSGYIFVFIMAWGLLPGTNFVKAQTLFVLDGNNVQNEFALEDVSKLTFPAGSLLITSADGNTASFNLEALSYLSFTDFATQSVPIENPDLGALKIYPNPAGNVLNILFDVQETGNCIFSVYDLYGRVLIKRETSSQMENNRIAINVEELPEGIYFLRMQQKQSIITTKFLKN